MACGGGGGGAVAPGARQVHVRATPGAQFGVLVFRLYVYLKKKDEILTLCELLTQSVQELLVTNTVK